MKEKYFFDILNNISEYATLVQLMYSVCNVNHAVIVVRKWIFDYNHTKALPLKMDSLHFIYDFSDE